MGNLYLLAPMAEISHSAFRVLIDEFGGCDLYFSEMLSAGAVCAGGPFEKWYINTDPKPEKLVFQIIGNDLQQITRAAAILDKLDCAGIDINMGCSAPKIRKTGAGAAWMADIDRAGELVSNVRQAVKHRLSVKLRLGFKDDFDYLARFCRRLESEGVEFITLHPRLITEKFKRRARWDYVGMLQQELKIPVAGNGDIASSQELVSRADEYGSVMAGRAAVRQPWIFAEALKNFKYEIPNIEETGLRFLELLAVRQPPEFHVSRAMRFFSYFCDNLKWGNYLKNKLNRENTLLGIERVWRDYFKNEQVDF